jgi:hypothetical protein
MEVGTTRRPGQKGTKRLQARFGDRLLYVRYRYDRDAGRRYTTAEIIIDSQPWVPRAASPAAFPDPETAERSAPRARADSMAPAADSGTSPREHLALVGLRVAYHEEQLRARVKAAGGKWDAQRRLWLLPLHRARALDLNDRIVPDPPPKDYASDVPDLAAGARYPR